MYKYIIFKVSEYHYRSVFSYHCYTLYVFWVAMGFCFHFWNPQCLLPNQSLNHCVNRLRKEPSGTIGPYADRSVRRHRG